MRIGIALLICATLSAHELSENRATLVLRDKTHVSVTLYVSYPEALHLALAPKQPFQEFLLTYSSISQNEFQKELLRAQSKFQAGVKMYALSGDELTLSNWIWPDARQVQALLQQRVMQAIADPGGHTHEPPAEIHADGNAKAEVMSLRAKFPPEFQRVLVVSYRPNQLWVEPGGVSSGIRF